MRDILFQLMMVHGIHGLADSWKLSHRIHSPYEKSIIERTVQYIKREWKVSMTIFLVEKTNVNCNTYKNGLIYLSVIITIICLTLQSHPNILIRLHVYFSGYHWLISFPWLNYQKMILSYLRMLEIQFNNVSSGIVKRTTKERIVLWIWLTSFRYVLAACCEMAWTVY